ncbi:TonB-dependent receptor domain-containing protein [Nitrincola tapanii]|uniref:TonB-dependent receptor domain-containing protein n=1 Tax=Nitrincola tapanii TaxID=1708751 RepID=UPI00135ACED5|nr:TonB-dependent receptor [Nitrincola tapanii]
MNNSLLNRKPLHKTLLASAILAASLSAQAENHHLDPLLVTVTTPLRIDQPLRETLAATSVITRAEIERRQPESVAQLLRGFPGVEFASNGGAGSQTSLFLRGSNSNHTLVLIDGVKANSPIDGSVRWEFIPVSQIERIEIVRGPQSSVWGADAIGGVVNIITRKAALAGTQGEIRVGAGQQNTQLTDASFSATQEATRFNSALSYRKSDGFNATQADTSGEKDGFEHYALRLQVEQDLDERNTLSAGYLRSQGTNEYDCWDHPLCKQNFALQTLNLGWIHQLTENWLLDTALQRVDEDRRDFRAGQSNGQVKTQRDQLGLKATFTTERYRLVTGLDTQKERLLEATNFSRKSREIYGLFLQTHYQIHEAWTLSLGARHDDDAFFGEQTNANLGVSWQINDVHTLGATLSQGYRAPNFIELYGPAWWGANPNLKAEEALNHELFWRYQPNNAMHAEIRVFQNDIDNLIVWTNGQNININKSRIRGSELSLGYQLAQWQFGAAITLQDPMNRQDDSLLLRRAREHGRIDVDYQDTIWGAGFSLEGQSKRYDFGDQRMGGYALVNTRAHWQLAKDWRLSAKIDNLFDKDYEQALGYNTPSRYFETSLTYRF